MGAAVTRVDKRSNRRPAWIASETVEIRERGGYFPIWNWFVRLAPRKLVPAVRDVTGQILSATNGQSIRPKLARDEHPDDFRPRWAALTEVQLCNALILDEQSIRKVFAEFAEDMVEGDTWETVCDRMSDAASESVRSHRANPDSPVKVRFIVCRKLGRNNHYALHPDTERLINYLDDREFRTRVPKKGPDVEEEYQETGPEREEELARKVHDGRHLYSDKGIRFRSASKSTPVRIPARAKEVEVEVHASPGPVQIRFEDAGAIQRIHVDVEKPREKKPVVETKEVVKTIPLPGYRYSGMISALTSGLNGNAPEPSEADHQKLKPLFEELMQVSSEAALKMLADTTQTAHRRGKELRTFGFAPHLVKDAIRDIRKGFDLAGSQLEVHAGGNYNDFDAWCAERKIPTGTGGEFLSAAEQYETETGRHL